MAIPQGARSMVDSRNNTTINIWPDFKSLQIISLTINYYSPSINYIIFINIFFSKKMSMRKLIKFMQNIKQCYTNNCNKSS